MSHLIIAWLGLFIGALCEHFSKENKYGRKLMEIEKRYKELKLVHRKDMYETAKAIYKIHHE